MGLKSYYRYRHNGEQRSRRLLETWVACLPAGRTWVGTFPDLEEELLILEDDQKTFAVVPRPAGLRSLLEQNADLFDRAGYAVEFTRTNSARLIRVRPVTADCHQTA